MFRIYVTSAGVHGVEGHGGPHLGGLGSGRRPGPGLHRGHGQEGEGGAGALAGVKHGAGPGHHQARQRHGQGVLHLVLLNHLQVRTTDLRQIQSAGRLDVVIVAVHFKKTKATLHRARSTV